MQKKAGKAKESRKRPAVRDLSAKKSGATKGGIGMLVPAVQGVCAPSSAQTRSITDGTSNTILR